MSKTAEFTERFSSVDSHPLHRQIITSISCEDGPLSQLSPVKEIVLVVPTPLLRPHELVESQNLATIDFSEGWGGAPISVAGLYDDHLFHQLEPGFYVATHLIMEELRQLMVIDGQTRLTKLQQDDIPVALVQLFSLNHESLRLDTWIMNFEPLTIDQVRLAAQTRCQVPAKATKFEIVIPQVGPVRIMDAQRRWLIPHQALVKEVPRYWDQELGFDSEV